MTAVPKDPKISELRELFRHLLEFRSVYEATGLEEISTHYGNTWSLWDLEYLYEKSKTLLTPRQAQAITLCLVHNRKEKDAARDMGVSPTNPVMMYATLGLRRLLDLIESGELTRFDRDEAPAQGRVSERHRRSLHALADHIKSQVLIVVNDCWAYRSPRAPFAPPLRIRSVYSASGFITVHPNRVLYEAYIRPLPNDLRLVHRPSGFVHPACINPRHCLIAK